MPIYGNKQKTSTIEEMEDYNVPVFVDSFWDSVRHRSVYNVKLEIKYGKNVNTLGPQGRTAGHFAAYDGDARMLKMLLDRGLDITIKDDDGLTVPEIVQDMPELREVLDVYLKKVKAEEDKVEASTTMVKTLQTALRDSQLLTSEKEEKRVSRICDSDSSNSHITEKLNSGNSSPRSDKS